MPPLDVDQSRTLLARVVQTLYDSRHSPVPGAVVKAEIIKEAEQGGSSFSERSIGFKSFVEFVRSTPGIAVQIRVGSDMLLAPASAAETLSAYIPSIPRVRRDLWRAFIEFPVVDTVRIYDQTEDKVFYEPASTPRKGVLIEPVSRSEQLRWRSQFAEQLPDDIKQVFLSSLEGAGTSPFNEFARRLREKPTVLKAWNKFHQKLVSDQVALWAGTNNISDEYWMGAGSDSFRLSAEDGRKVRTLGPREELYSFFDSLPIEDLLQLRVPLEWVLKVTRNKQ